MLLAVSFLIHPIGPPASSAGFTAQVRVARAFGERRLVVAIGEDGAPLLAMMLAVPVHWHICSTPPAACGVFSGNQTPRTVVVGGFLWGGGGLLFPRAGGGFLFFFFFWGGEGVGGLRGGALFFLSGGWLPCLRGCWPTASDAGAQIMIDVAKAASESARAPRAHPPDVLPRTSRPASVGRDLL